MKSTRLAALAGIAATAVAASFLAPTATPADAAPSAGNPRLEAQQAASAWVKGHGNALERASQDSFVRTGTFEGDNQIYSMAYERRSAPTAPPRSPWACSTRAERPRPPSW